MTAVARQLSARELGAGRWRVELALARDPNDDGAHPRPHPSTVILRPRTAGAGAARVESLVVAPPSARGRFSVVVALDAAPRAGAPARFELSGAGWFGHVEITPPEEPATPTTQTPASVPATIDYRARDFTALRTMLLGVIDEHVGDGLADHPVSQTSALVEQLAYLGDALSYRQDAAATEAYLATARRRVSVVRHAALLDYPVFEGAAARAWVRFTVSSHLRLPARTIVLARAPDLELRLPPEQLPRAIGAGALVFETLRAVELYPDRAPFEITADQNARGLLPSGATSATVLGRHAALHAGALVLLEPSEIPGPGQVVRLTAAHQTDAGTRIEWSPADALAGELPNVALWLRTGNLVLVEHARSHGWTSLPVPTTDRRYWPRLPVPGLAFARVGFDGPSAEEMLTAAGERPRPAVDVRAGDPPNARRWTWRESLLESGPLDLDYVVEVEERGYARLRFGDNTDGMRPPAGAGFAVRMRSGGGADGNVGAGSIAHVVSANDQILRVRNPAAAVGGADPEPLASVRVNAPRAFRSTDRAVVPGEYTAAALAVDGVTDATAIIVPTGTGPLARVRIHTGDWAASSGPIVDRVRQELDRRRPVGVALDVRAAAPSPVTIELDVAVPPGWTLRAMSTTLDQELGRLLLGPGRFGFGTGLYRSELVAALAGLPGITDVTLTRFDWTTPPFAGIEREELVPPFGHVIRVANDLRSPDIGSVTFRLRNAP